MFGKRKSNKSLVKKKGYRIEEARIDSTLFRCSQCGFAHKEAYSVCPSCGALMRKIKYNPIWIDEISLFYEDDF